MTWSTLALGLRSLSRWCASSCFWDGFGSRFSTEDWTHGNVVSDIYLIFLPLIAAAPCKDNKVQLILLGVQSESPLLFSLCNWSNPISFSWNMCHTVCFYFIQIVLQEKRPKSPGGGQSEGSNRGGLQETRAHKVRTRVCFQISCETRWTSAFFFAQFQLRGGIDLFLFYTVCRSPVHARSQICHRLVCVFQKRVRFNEMWSAWYKT